MSPTALPELKNIHTVAFDFDGVFTNNKVWVDQEGSESVRCDRGDGLALDIARVFKRQGKFDAELFVLSKESNHVVRQRAQKLQLHCQHCIGNKLKFMQEYLNKRFPSLQDPFAGLVFLGNDLNDLPLMRRAGFSVAPMDAHPLALEISDLVIQRRGGDGMVREFIERLLRIDELTEDEIDELVSNC